MSTKQILETVFNDVRLVTFVYDNKEVWFASQIAQVLGYAKSGKLSTLIRTKWAEDFEERLDFYTASRSEIGPVVYSEDPQWGSSKARHYMLFTEAGVNNVLRHTRKPIGKQLRRHLDTVVLPQFRRGMIVERPVEELLERQREELYQLKDELLRDKREIIKRDGRIMELQDERAEWLEETSYVRKMASNAGKSLQACKGARRNLAKECSHLRLVEEGKKAG